MAVGLCLVACPVAAKSIDNPVQAAVALLPEDIRSTMPEITLVEEQASAGRVTQGYVEPENPVIHLNALSPNFQKAAKGNEKALMLLASVIAHEHSHAVYGTTEADAYAVQIATLKSLNAPSELVAVVEAGRDVILSIQRGVRK